MKVSKYEDILWVSFSEVLGNTAVFYFVYQNRFLNSVSVKVKFTLEQATMAQRGS